MSDQKPTGKSIIEGTLAQFFGGALASTLVIGLSSFDIEFKPGFETAFGTLLTIIAYLSWKGFRRR